VLLHRFHLKETHSAPFCCYHEVFMTDSPETHSTYHRYHIETRDTPEVDAWPTRFEVKVGKIGLAKWLISEIIHTRADIEVVTSRPCLYGVFSGPIGGFAPRPHLCVGCLRCTTQHPDFVRISSNPERRKMGDSYFTFRHLDVIASEAEGGRVPVKGAGYRGAFGGSGWDGMWTDMSEIVRPTRDGIHGREFISTVVDIGGKPNFLTFDINGEMTSALPHIFRLQVPFAFDVLPDQISSSKLIKIFTQAAAEIESMAVVPIEVILTENLRGGHLVPLVTRTELVRLSSLPFEPRMIELEGGDLNDLKSIEQTFPDTLICLRMSFVAGSTLMDYFKAGVRVFHLTADYHGQDTSGAFIFDLIRKAHLAFVDAGVREMVTLLGSGGMIAAEHLPKAIIAGLDVVLIDAAPLVAMQARLDGEYINRGTAHACLPRHLDPAWGVQRLKNFAAAWRDQMLEILGAMGLREVRRLRGEIGRAMFQHNLEREAFENIDGYPKT
jgi:hypothetical protein